MSFMPSLPFSFVHERSPQLMELLGKVSPISQALLGHSSLAVTKIYTHVSLSAQRKALRNMHPGRGTKAGGSPSITNSYLRTYSSPTSYTLTSPFSQIQINYCCPAHIVSAIRILDFENSIAVSNPLITRNYA